MNNNNIVNNIENNNNITFNGFCHENVSYLTANISTDNRLNNVCKRISDTIDLVHFNADHPENQTIRKLNKKSEFLEIRTPNNTWEMENDKIGIEKMQRNLEQTFQTKFDDADDLNRSALSEMLYQKTLRGEIPEEEILNKYDINTPHGRRMIEYNCDAQVRRKTLEYFRENDVTEATAATGTVWMRRDLRNIENEVRNKYGLQTKPEIIYVPAHLRNQ